MNTIDILVLVVLVLNGVLGAFRGFVSQAFRLAGIAAAILLAWQLGPKLADAAQAWVGWDEGARKVAAYGLIFVAVYVVATLLGFLLRKTLEKMRLGSADRALGFVLGCVKGAVFTIIAFQLVLLVWNVLPRDVQIQFQGDPQADIAGSRAFKLHVDLFQETVDGIFPKDWKQDVAKGVQDFRGR